VSKYNQRGSKKYRGYRPRRDRKPKELCPICNKPVSYLITAVVHRETGKKAHFDCIIKELRRSYQLKPREDVYYLGGGIFGVVETKGKKNSSFIVKRRIQYEERD